ncbi:alpha/beta hydrolase [Verticiella sediminum]|uniref:Alpha/beta hydrolase n=2 Tax=Verticiella sediminum TaxID=1247510 RepID=A0A556AWT3_9BURK|nr:alpha/beta hydrolase [Verticiella sediminum]
MQRPFEMVPYALGTADGQRTLGFLFSVTGKEKGVVCIMHPREIAITHYMVPAVLDAGWACWVQAPRSPGNDLRLEHEIALFDVAAGLNHLRAHGFEEIVLLGNSGGAGLYTFYNEQARSAPEQRIAKTPGGRSTRLAELQMPVPEGIVLLSPHPGQGRLLMVGLDPSVLDEQDAMSCDPALDPFSRANGFDADKGVGRYTPEFVAAYGQAQRARVERLDAQARRLLDAKGEARRRLKQGSATEQDRRVAAHAPIFQVWRTDADLRAWDPTLDPSDRKVGSLWGRNPFVSNWGSVGFARVVTPESWLSTWSGIASNASLERTAPAIVQPTLLIEYTGDQCTFPADIQAIRGQIGSIDLSFERIRGNHHGMALAEGERPGRELASEVVTRWLRERAGQFASAGR